MMMNITPKGRGAGPTVPGHESHEELVEEAPDSLTTDMAVEFLPGAAAAYLGRTKPCYLLSSCRLITFSSIGQRWQSDFPAPFASLKWKALVDPRRRRAMSYTIGLLC